MKGFGYNVLKLMYKTFDKNIVKSSLINRVMDRQYLGYVEERVVASDASPSQLRHYRTPIVDNTDDSEDDSEDNSEDNSEA